MQICGDSVGFRLRRQHEARRTAARNHHQDPLLFALIGTHFDLALTMRRVNDDSTIRNIISVIRNYVYVKASPERENAVSKDDDRGSGMRTVALLKVIAESGRTFSLSELAANASLPPSSVHRLLQPLLRGGFVERAEGQSYCVGREFLRVSSLIMQRFDVGRLARPILQRLAAEWEETCSLCVYRPAGHLALVIETIPTLHPLRFVIEPFAELSLTWGSLGRAILAWLPPADAEAAMQRPGLGPLSGLPLANAESLAEAIAEVRAAGFAQYRNELVDVAGVAAPVFSGDGRILGSLGITAPAQRLGLDAMPAMAQAVKSAATELSELLGYRG